MDPLYAVVERLANRVTTLEAEVATLRDQSARLADQMTVSNLTRPWVSRKSLRRVAFEGGEIA